MKPFLDLFPQNDFSLIAVVLLMPLLGAFVNGVFGRRLGKPAVRMMALSAVGVSFAAAIATFVALNGAVDAAHAANGEPAHTKLAWLAWEWMRVSGPNGSKIAIDLKFSVDALSGVMMLVVTGVGFLIHVYSTEYMASDKGYWRFFCYLNLFIFSMLVLILGDSLPVLFIGWEGVGLCSYLLIGFWYGKMPNAAAGKKAFIANRIGDFGLIVAMFLLVVYCGALDWDGIQRHANDLVALTDRPGAINLWPIGGGRFEDFVIGGLRIPLHYLQPDKPWTITAATAVGLMLFLGATGKSAQLPLYVWLPDAMAGPTPVSALIHAATMVTAGIYLICRLSFVFVLSPAAMIVVAFTGAATALLAATIAVVQTDIKRVLAYSTVSQLGFMVLGVGVGAFTAGFFHVFTHAFFKACLFLGAGSVIHAMHARVHDEAASQDMRNMGGLKKYMPLTYGTFLASTLCIIGFPLTSGFFSKDEILARVLIETPSGVKLANAAAPWQWPSWAPWVLWTMGVLAATLTAFYMMRLVFQTFWGEFRGWTIGRPSQLPKTAHEEHGHTEYEAGEDGDEDHHEHHDDLSQPGAPPHESPRTMTIPLLILAAAAIVAGIFNPAAIKLVVSTFSFLPLEHWLDPVFKDAARGIVTADHHTAHTRELISTAGAFTAFAAGSGVAYWVYVKEAGRPARELMLKVPRLYRLVLEKWRVDELYDKTVVSGVDALADTAASVDQGIIDFILARLTALIVAATGTVLRVIQNGVVHVYAAVMVVGMVGLGWFFVEPHADFTVVEQNGDYTLQAGSGPGYEFRWYPDATKEPQTKDFSVSDNLKVHVADGKSQTVKLEVKNAFGRIGTKAYTITRPASPISGAGTVQIREQ
ncbi:MAG: NADH-quinone oxidoreductase subunit L [Myxococcales bacterium 68-20]|nr:NADH-quinone oxidoreductase subunit L [Myxococcales bacterium]OJY26465.1 MAG: NADH-quinone oxidoreductase subunit L [Myxococcales bacterium 68-20]